MDNKNINVNSFSDKAILKNIPSGLVVFTVDKNHVMNFIYANDGFYDELHGSREFWLGKKENPAKWCVQDDIPTIRNEIELVVNNKKCNGDVYFKVVGEDEKLHHISVKFRRCNELGDKNENPVFIASCVCVDEKKKAEDERREAIMMYEAAVKETMLVVWEYDITKHRIIMAENEFTEYDYRKFGLPKVMDNVPQSLIPYIDDNCVSAFLEMYKKIDNGEKRASCEVWYKIRVGVEPRCERITCVSVFDAEGKPVKAYGIGQNITSYMRERESYNSLYKQLKSNLSGAVSSTQLNISRNLYIGGYSPYKYIEKQLEQKTADEHFCAAASAIVDESIKKSILEICNCKHFLELFRNGEKTISCDYPVKTQKGKIIWVHTVFYLVLNPDTGDLEAISYATNITKQRRNEEILNRLSRESCDFIGIIDVSAPSFELHSGKWDCAKIEQGDTLNYNKAFEDLAYRYIAPDERAAFIDAVRLDKITAELDKEESYVVAYNIVKKNGAALKKQLRLSRLDNELEILVVQSDVTEAYRQERARLKEMENALLHAEQANEMKTAFLGNVSHDMRTPLNAILGYNRMAIDEKDEKKQLEYMRKISIAGETLLSLINDTLDLQRIENGVVRLFPEPISCSEALGDIITTMKPLMEEKHIKFVLDNSRAVMADINIDLPHMRQIFINIFSNAVKFTPVGGTIEMIVECIGLEPECVHDRLIIRDNGVGMSNEFQKKMFEPFSQERTAETADIGGSGLGLSIVKRLVELMSGKIEVKSELGKGTEVTVYLDFPRVNNYKVTNNGENTDEIRLDGLKLLMCEDNRMNSEIARHLLETSGAMVTVKDNGQLGLERFVSSEKGEFDAILMDIRMPVMNGYDAAQAIRCSAHPDAKNIPIIAMTADAYKSDIEKAFSCGMNGHIAKPLDPHKMLDEIYRVIYSQNTFNQIN